MTIDPQKFAHKILKKITVDVVFPRLNNHEIFVYLPIRKYYK